MSYVSPKQLDQLVDEFHIIVEPRDRKWVYVSEAAEDPAVWPALMWGGARDKVFLQHLKSRLTLANAEQRNIVSKRKGIIFGDRKKPQPKIRGRRILDGKDFPAGSLLYLNADDLPKNKELQTDSRASTDFSAFACPQLIVKQGWKKSLSRFQARITKSSRSEGALCTQSYLTVHAREGQQNPLEAACLALNSIFATYFLLLTSSRFASYRPEPLVEELLNVPIPKPRPRMLQGIKTWEDIDARMFEEFAFKESERVLVEDLFRFTLADFRGDENSFGRQRTVRLHERSSEPQLTGYCEHVIRVLKAGFGRDKSISATIFQEETDPLPYRLIAFELGGASGKGISTKSLRTSELLTEFERLNRIWSEHDQSRGSSVYHRRIARIYDGQGNTPAIFIIKPDLNQYWTRSAGLSDGDEIALDFFRWRGNAETSAAIAE